MKSLLVSELSSVNVLTALSTAIKGDCEDVGKQGVEGINLITHYPLPITHDPLPKKECVYHDK